MTDIINDLVESLLEQKTRFTDVVNEEKRFVQHYLTNIENDDPNFASFHNGKIVNKLILIIYATYENVVKNMMSSTLETLGKLNSTASDKEEFFQKLKDELKILAFRQKLEDLENTFKEGIEQRTESALVNKLLRTYNIITNVSEFRYTDNMMTTKSNLNFELFMDFVLLFLNNDDSSGRGKYYRYKKTIEVMLANRNKIAHGDVLSLPESDDDIRIVLSPTTNLRTNDIYYENFCDELLELINHLERDLSDFITENRYVKI